jgi:hypothetical protein
MIIAILEIYTGDVPGPDTEPTLAYYDLDKARPEFKNYCYGFINMHSVSPMKFASDSDASTAYGNQCSLDDSAVVFPPCLVEFTLYRIIKE